MIFPLISRDVPMGVVEVEASTHELMRAHEVLVAVTEQSAEALRASREAIEAERALRSADTLLSLTGALLEARSPVSALRATVGACSDSLGIPVAGILPDRSGQGWYLAAVRGLGSRRRTELRKALRGLPEKDRNRVLEELRTRFAAPTGSATIFLEEVGEAILVAAGPSEVDTAFLQGAVTRLERTLSQLGEVSWARVRNANLDLGIAWTAHELRAPLLGARAALDQVLGPQQDGADRDLLQRARQELDQLSELVHPLLQWSSGQGSLRRREVDLVEVVRGAAALCRFEGGDDRLMIGAPERVSLWADPVQLRTAISNVLRNALLYSPPGSPVRVTVRDDDEAAKICIRDQGPGVPASERRTIFDPFARGKAGRSVRGGRGLGLFIARRIIEVHGGSIAVRSARIGSEFWIELPVETLGRQASAS
jgi:signal transduction histidine kinase